MDDELLSIGIVLGDAPDELPDVLPDVPDVLPDVPDGLPDVPDMLPDVLPESCGVVLDGMAGDVAGPVVAGGVEVRGGVTVVVEPAAGASVVEPGTGVKAGLPGWADGIVSLIGTWPAGGGAPEGVEGEVWA